MNTTLSLNPAGDTLTETFTRANQIETLPARLDVHRLDEFQSLCTTDIARDLLIDASEVRFIDTAALAFLENLDTVRRTAGAAVHYLHPSPALVATFELHGSKLADPELMVR
jgi:anti-anti-sigma regulatory factor